MSKQILVFPGDGIGPEIVAEAVKVLEVANEKYQLGVELSYDELGGAAFENTACRWPTKPWSAPAPPTPCCLAPSAARNGTPSSVLRPESGLLKIRAQLGLFANLRPAILYPQLAGASSLKAEIVAGLDILIVRELTGGIYFGQPAASQLENGERQGFDTMLYSESEIERIARVGFDMARQRGKNCARWTRPTCWRPADCGATWSRRWPRNIRTSN